MATSSSSTRGVRVLCKVCNGRGWDTPGIKCKACDGGYVPAGVPVRPHDRPLCADCTTEHACKNRLDVPRPCGVTPTIETGQALFERYDDAMRLHTGIGVSRWDALPSEFRAVWNTVANGVPVTPKGLTE